MSTRVFKIMDASGVAELAVPDDVQFIVHYPYREHFWWCVHKELFPATLQCKTIERRGGFMRGPFEPVDVLLWEYRAAVYVVSKDGSSGNYFVWDDATVPFEINIDFIDRTINKANAWQPAS